MKEVKRWITIKGRHIPIYKEEGSSYVLPEGENVKGIPDKYKELSVTDKSGKFSQTKCEKVEQELANLDIDELEDMAEDIGVDGFFPGLNRTEIIDKIILRLMSLGNPDSYRSTK